ncbi:16S rRNA (guanine(527)-N(7))-methyltransferase RsmG [Bartonella tamiae]|uniref:Ribosomal RNA small subunit methyltransferase G n=1 Tax=Bartonella tamiae Th239 TaxID=1094558 RepID=J0QY15_9HYPH|nr:16S rRNA (guanine(527)-N(7))-methyltransferase RsmG [Bartonella tamiae]EJF90976.1 16S rRNA (guanine(527)-N(7))-methyltransferase GidB [Bartonella tamiae Th239]EJF93359.1 16S rRNA (guanine(527)-N(7))-methyltransferase GidB [Bartonella tamiae Th307]
MNKNAVEKIAALKQIIPSVSRETEESFLFYEAELTKWQKHINLIANTTIPNIWNRHILDSAQIFNLASHAMTWCDIGSGGGFPGLVTAILLKGQKKGSLHLIESNHKKAAFLQHMIAQLDLPAHVHNARIEDSTKKIEAPEVITARALAPLNALLSLCRIWTEKGSNVLFPKGREYQKEIDQAKKHWEFELEIFKSKIDVQSVILKMTNIRAYKG